MGIFGSSRDEYEGDGGVPWATTCKSDPRFDMQGEAPGISTAMLEVDDAVKKRAEELRIPPTEIPADIAARPNRAWCRGRFGRRAQRAR